MRKVLLVVDFQKDFVDGALGFPGAEALGGVDLAAHPGEDHQAAGQPHEHPGRPDRRDAAGARPADPDHIHHVVRHLDEGGAHNGEGQPGQGPGDGALQQIKLLFHRSSCLLLLS